MDASYQLRNSLLENDLSSISKLIRDRKISPKELAIETIKKIQEINPKINAYICVLEDQMLKQAAMAEEEIMAGRYKGRLHGIPIGLKDLIFTKSVPTTMGSKLFKDFIPKVNADVTDHLIESGAIITGKLNTHELAFGTTGDVSYFDAVRNPYNLDKISGGSSSGSAAAVATNLCLASIGTDTGGSIRIPASFCHVVGMKPTFGRISKMGVQDLAPSLDHVGILTKSVKDNALLLNHLQAGADLENFLLGINHNINGIRVGIPQSFFMDHLDDEISHHILKVTETYKLLGAEIVPIHIEYLEEMSAAHRTILLYEAYQVYKNRIGEMDEGEVKNRLASGSEMTESEYDEAKAVQKKGKHVFRKVFQQADVLLTPNTPIIQTDIDVRNINFKGNEVHIFSLLNKLTGITNLTGLPSVSIPGGFIKSGLPIGFQLIGQAFDEQTLYKVGHAYEQTLTD